MVEDRNGKVKARFVVRGNEERGDPRSDSPTASKDSFKTFLALSANEGFEVKTLDVTTAFLQGNPLDRDIYIEPPPEKADSSIVWKLKKACYGLYDASRRWYMAVRETLLSMGMKSVTGDDAFFYLNKKGKLHGLCVLHVDDFLIGGDSYFYDIVQNNLVDKFTFGKIEMEQFKFTGLNIQQTEEGIHVDQDEYVKSIKPIKFGQFITFIRKLF